MIPLNQKRSKKIQREVEQFMAKHVPSETKYDYLLIDTYPLGLYNSWDSDSDPDPFNGEIVAYSRKYMLVKISSNSYRVIDLRYVTDKPPIGSMVKVTPYARRNFKGDRTDSLIRTLTSWKERGIAKSYGMHKALLPIPRAIQSPYLKSLVSRIEYAYIEEGYRSISEILVDAGADDFSIVDPSYEEVISQSQLPSIQFRIDGVMVNYFKITFDPLTDSYQLDMTCKNQIIASEHGIKLSELWEHLVPAIDDGSWQRTKVEVLAE